MSLKSIIRSLPVIGPLSYKLVPARPFKGSAAYWEDRYREGGNSGAGSYSRLAAFKAEVLNDFVQRRGIQSVIEFGSGDGNQLLLAEYPQYLGVDVSTTAIAVADRMFADRAEITFVQSANFSPATQADLTLSLDVIYHLVEDEVFDAYMHQLFAAARENVIIYASNEDKAWTSPHVRHRQFTRWIEEWQPGWIMMNHVPNRYPFDAADPDNTSFAEFWIFQRVA